MTEFSQNELKLIKSIDEKMYNACIKVSMSPIGVYTILAVQCFAENRHGPEVEALRRAMAHFESNGYRCNSEFEKLIEF